MDGATVLGSASVAVTGSSFRFRFLMLDVDDGSGRARGVGFFSAGALADVLCVRQGRVIHGGDYSSNEDDVNVSEFGVGLNIPDQARTKEQKGLVCVDHWVTRDKEKAESG